MNESRVIIVSHGLCTQCGHLAVRTDEPWDNQFRCGKGCRCTMQGCCLSAARPMSNGAPA